MSVSATTMPASPRRRNFRREGVILCVLLLHGLGLWALQSGLVGRAVETLTTLPVLVSFAEAPAPPVAPPAVHPVAPTLRPRPVHEAPVQRAPAPAPLPAHMTEEPPAPVATPAPEPGTAEPVMTASVAPVPLAEPPPPPPIVLPSSSAAYLHNPPPPYPAASRQLGEAGRVVVRVFIGLEGTALQAQLAVSSGYDRLDAVALQTARRWRYQPGREGGIPKPMWFDVPIHFVLGH